MNILFQNSKYLVFKTIVILVIISCSFLHGNEKNILSHGIIGEITENGAGLYFSSEINKINLYSKIGFHFERSNKIKVDPFYNTQNPGFKKTIGAIGIGFRKSIFKNSFSRNINLNVISEYTIGNTLQNLLKSNFNKDYNRFTVGLSFQIFNGDIFKRYDFCFQNSNSIEGIFLIRIHFMKNF